MTIQTPTTHIQCDDPTRGVQLSAELDMPAQDGTPHGAAIIALLGVAAFVAVAAILMAALGVV